MENEFQSRPKQTGSRSYFQSSVPHPPLVFNNASVSQYKSQKQLGIVLDLKLTFEDHYKTVLSKTCRTKGLLRKL